MELNTAKERLQNFLGGRVLTFSIRPFPNGEWIAECNEIPAIATGGLGNDISNMDAMIRDAIFSAAGVDIKYSSEILKFVGYKATGHLASFFKQEEAQKEAEYVVA